MSYKFIFNNKKLSEITKEDLESLKTNKVAEGWYIEYKREMPDSKKIAAGIASFANQFGGYFIIGIEDSGYNIATDIFR